MFLSVCSYDTANLTSFVRMKVGEFALSDIVWLDLALEYALDEIFAKLAHPRKDNTDSFDAQKR